jgi:hypothetical protein
MEVISRVSGSSSSVVCIYSCHHECSVILVCHALLMIFMSHSTFSFAPDLLLCSLEDLESSVVMLNMMAESVSANLKSVERKEYRLVASTPATSSTADATTSEKDGNTAESSSGQATEAAAAASVSMTSYYYAIIDIEVCNGTGSDKERNCFFVVRVCLSTCSKPPFRSSCQPSSLYCRHATMTTPLK